MSFYFRGGKSALRVNKKTSEHICENSCIVWTKVVLKLFTWEEEITFFVKDSLALCIVINAESICIVESSTGKCQQQLLSWWLHKFTRDEAHSKLSVHSSQYGYFMKALLRYIVVLWETEHIQIPVHFSQVLTRVLGDTVLQHETHLESSWAKCPDECCLLVKIKFLVYTKQRQW